MRQTKLQKGKLAVTRVIECGLALLPTALQLGSPEWQLFAALDALSKECDLEADFAWMVAQKCNAGTVAEQVGKKP